VFLFFSILTSVIFQVRLYYVTQRVICGSIFHLFLTLMQMVCATMPCCNSETVQTGSNLMHSYCTVMNRQYSQDMAYNCMLTHHPKFCLKHSKPLRSMLNHQIKFATALGDHSLIYSIDAKRSCTLFLGSNKAEMRTKGMKDAKFGANRHGKHRLGTPWTLHQNSSSIIKCLLCNLEFVSQGFPSVLSNHMLLDEQHNAISQYLKLWKTSNTGEDIPHQRIIFL